MGPADGGTGLSPGTQHPAVPQGRAQGTGGSFRGANFTVAEIAAAAGTAPVLPGTVGAEPGPGRTGWFIINVLKLQACSCLLLNYECKSTGHYLGAEQGGLRFSSFLGGKCCQRRGLPPQPAGRLWHPWAQGV